MDKSCYDEYQAGGIACVSTTYPIAAAAYYASNCPGIDTCISQLGACKTASSSGNDNKDCASDQMQGCFAAADNCIADKVLECGQPPPPPPDTEHKGFCATFGFILWIVAASVFFVSRKH